MAGKNFWKMKQEEGSLPKINQHTRKAMRMARWFLSPRDMHKLKQGLGVVIKTKILQALQLHQEQGELP